MMNGKKIAAAFLGAVLLFTYDEKKVMSVIGRSADRKK